MTTPTTIYITCHKCGERIREETKITPGSRNELHLADAPPIVTSYFHNMPMVCPCGAKHRVKVSNNINIIYLGGGKTS